MPNTQKDCGHCMYWRAPPIVRPGMACECIAVVDLSEAPSAVRFVPMRAADGQNCPRFLPVTGRQFVGSGVL